LKHEAVLQSFLYSNYSAPLPLKASFMRDNHGKDVTIHSKTTVEQSQEYGCTTAFQIPVFEVRDASICCHPAICFLGSLKQTSYDVCLSASGNVWVWVILLMSEIGGL
jgi:hypothetical protein